VVLCAVAFRSAAWAYGPWLEKIPLGGVELGGADALDRPALERGLAAIERDFADRPLGVRRAKALAYCFDHVRLAVNTNDLFVHWHADCGLLPGAREQRVAAFARAAAKDDPARYAGAWLADDGAFNCRLDTSHTCPDWASVLALGPRGLAERARKRRVTARTDAERVFLDGVVEVYEALARECVRWADFAAAKGMRAVADVLREIAVHPPQTFREALQWSLVYDRAQEAEGEDVRSQGLFDRLFIGFYRADLAAGRETRDSAKRLLADYYTRLWSQQHNNGKNIGFGGYDAGGRPVWNELTELGFEVFRELGRINPKLTYRFGKKTPREQVACVTRCLAEGKTSVVFACDDTLYESFRRRGKEPRDLADYVLVGCYEPGIGGREIIASMAADVNLAKPLEMVLMRPAATLPRTVADFERAYFDELAKLLEKAMAAARETERHWDELSPAPLFSGAFRDCIASARDAYSGGCRYNSSGIVLVGFGTVVDSLAAVRHLVETEKACTLAELAAAVRADWKGFETLRLKARNVAPKWGNNDVRADDLAKKLYAAATAQVNAAENGHGGRFQAGVWSIFLDESFGGRTGATPDGRCRGETLSRNNVATAGCGREGPTALMLSNLKLDLAEAPDGHILDLLLPASVKQRPSAAADLAAVIATYFERGGQCLHLNCFDAATLRDAYAHPEKYPDLQVRVCGWNVRWADLTPVEKRHFLLTAEAQDPAAPLPVPETSVIGLQVNRLTDEAHNVGAHPVFSWRLASDRNGARQTACRVWVDGVWDSGVCEGSDSLGFKYGGPALAPMRRYTWRVSVRDELDRWSAPATGTFCTGTLGGEVWRATAWIRPAETNAPGLRVAAFRKAVHTGKPVREAWLAVAAAGVFVARMNGAPVTENVLEPGLTHPFRRRQICTYDVTKLFNCEKDAANVLDVSVSPAWSRDMLSDRSRPWRQADPALPAELRAVVVLRHDDGTETRVVTDPTWEAAYDVDPVVTAGVYEGETVDARRSRARRRRWPRAVVSTTWKGVESDFRGPPIVLRRDLQLKPVSAVVVKGVTGASAEAFGRASEVRRYGADEPMALGPGEMLVVDFGQNASAVPEMTLEAAAGTHLTIRHGEMLNEGGGRKDRGNDGPEGTPYLANLRAAYAGIEYTCRGGADEHYRPQFSFFGYRYLSVTSSAPVTVRGLVSVPVSSVSAASEAGTLETGVPDVNRLFANCRWGMLSNYLSVPTDCPQRNERVGWTADTQVFAPAAACLADVHAFLAKWMLDMRDSQREDGCYSQVAPEANSVKGGITGWTDAGVFVPWTLWRKYGDTDVVDENWDSMCRYMAFLDRHQGHNHHPFGDWLSYESGDVPWLSKEREQWNIPAKEFLDDAYWFACARKMADMASATGREVASWRALAERVRRRFIGRNLTAEGAIKPDRLGQCTALVGLGFGLLDTDSARAQTRAALLKNLHEHGDRLQTGFLGTSVLMDTLSFEADAHAMAVTLLLQRENPSWLYSVDQGATTIWERWNSYTKKDGFGPIIMNSFNHYAYGAVAEWMFAALAGIREAEPGYRRIRLAPRPDARLGHVSARFRSPMGEIASAWSRDGDGWRWSCTVPPNAEADVTLPDGRTYVLGPGRHETVFTPKP